MFVVVMIEHYLLKGFYLLAGDSGHSHNQPKNPLIEIFSRTFW